MTSPALQDELLAFGEQLSAQLLAAVLREHNLVARYVDARRCILTDDSLRDCARRWRKLRKHADRVVPNH